MSVKTQAKAFVSSIANTGKNITTDFRAAIGKISDNLTTAVDNLVADSLIGIDVNKVPEMQTAIETYVKNIQDALDGVNENTDEVAKTAFANDEMLTTLSDFVQAVMDACKAYTSQLLKFHTLLGNIRQQYIDQQTAINDTLSQSSSDTRSSVTEYTVDSAEQ